MSLSTRIPHTFERLWLFTQEMESRGGAALGILLCETYVLNYEAMAV